MNSYIKNSADLKNRLSQLIVSPSDILVSFDVVSLFTNIPITEALRTIQLTHSPPSHIMEFTKHCLTSTYFSYKNEFYKQKEGAPMGSPLSPVIANLFMDDLENRAINSSELKPTVWLRYIDDCFAIWPHGKDALTTFLTHLNGINKKIQFTVETETDNALPFLDLLIRKKEDGHLTFSVYRKPTHTNRYLHKNSHHHPAQLQSVVRTLTHRAIHLSDRDYRTQEIKTLRDALTSNGYTDADINNAIRGINTDTHNISTEQTEDYANTLTLPYIKGTTDKIGRILKKFNIKTTYNAHKKLNAFLRSPKDHIHLEGQGVYEIPCRNCEKSYFGHSGRNIRQRVREHAIAADKQDSNNSLLTHIIETGHSFDFENTKIIAKINNKKVRELREGVAIMTNSNAVNNRNEHLKLPNSWKTALTGTPLKKVCRPLTNPPNVSTQTNGNDNKETHTKETPLHRVEHNNKVRQNTPSKQHNISHRHAYNTRSQNRLHHSP
jgi:hypothetical protein